MNLNTAGVGGRLGLAFSLQFKDKDGNVLKTMDFNGSVPLEDTGLSAEQAQELINQQGADRDHDCE